jgi:hypothetical protein
MTEQLNATDVAKMSAEEIVAAQKAGLLNEYLGGVAPFTPGDQWSASDLSTIYAQRRYDEIVAAQESGALSTLLGKDHE